MSITLAMVNDSSEQGTSSTRPIEGAGSIQSSSSNSTSSTTSTDASSTDSQSNNMSAERLVRFEEQCVLIPESTLLTPSKSSGPRIITKSLSLPIWKWSAFGSVLSSSSSHSVVTENAEGSQTAGGTSGTQDGQSPLHQGNLIVKVPIPVFRRRPSLSPVRHRHQDVCLLPPCLVHRSDSETEGTDRTPSRSRSRQKRSPSLPNAHVSSSPPSTSLCPLPETVPLRTCCEACLHGCDIPSAHWHVVPPPHSAPSIQQGHSDSAVSQEEEDWCAGMHFTKGALRRRRSSSASEERLEGRHRRRSASFSGHGSAGGSFSGTLVRVDEVDKLHDANVKVSMSEVPEPSSSPRPSAPSLSPLACNGIARQRTPSPTSLSPAALKAATRDTDELFPLPSPTRSPRRTPTGSPKISPSPSAANLLAGPSPQVLESAIKAKITTSSISTDTTPPSAVASPIPIPTVPSIGYAKVYPRPIRPAFRATPVRSILDDLEPYTNSDSEIETSENTINIDSPPPSPPAISQSPPRKTARRRPSIQGAIAGALRGFSLGSSSSGPSVCV
ncbi:hypothetical protein SCHPADRAFT_994232 [Schizopora paradoxa]|uniref:Uncharacterized protein n=1 Tax=Schizopora paradoxa TaxID=27342 RepID=A0A0H2RZM2_9AGAM|nr:hypothetical protein SCHPADRAFT_994232 [Schizopora paradoxa]